MEIVAWMTSQIGYRLMLCRKLNNNFSVFEAVLEEITVIMKEKQRSIYMITH